MLYEVFGIELDPGFPGLSVNLGSGIIPERGLYLDNYRSMKVILQQNIGIKIIIIIICDAIWENPPYVSHGDFTKINKIILKLLCFSLFFINFDNM